MKTLHHPPVHDRPRNEVSALVDIAFLLLIFFLVSTTILPTERDLALAVPPDTGAPSARLSPVTVSIGTDSSVSWGEPGSAIQVADPGEGRELPGLRDMLATSVGGAGTDGLVVLLRSAGEAPQQRFIDVLDALTAAGVTEIVLEEGFRESGADQSSRR